MISLSKFLLIAISVYAFVFLLIYLVTHTGSFKRQPVEDQNRIRKQTKIALICLPFALASVWFLLVSPWSFIQLLPLILYIGLWLFVFWFFWRSYRLAIKQDYSLIKNMAGKQLKNPENLAMTFAKLNFFVALSTAIFLILIPILHIVFNAWGPTLGVIVAIYHLAISLIEKKNNA